MIYVVGICVVAKIASCQLRRKNEQLEDKVRFGHAIPTSKRPSDNSVIARVR